MLAEHPRERRRLEWSRPGAGGAQAFRGCHATPSPARSRPIPANASAHYNLSFTLSHLGDFDGALRATKRALELEPFYVAQKYVAHHRPAVREPRDHRRAARSRPMSPRSWWATTSISTNRLLDRIFDELQPRGPRPRFRRRTTRWRWPPTFVAEGLAGARHGTHRARACAGDRPGRATTLLGEVFARRGLHGEALERFRDSALAGAAAAARHPGRGACAARAGPRHGGGGAG